MPWATVSAIASVGGLALGAFGSSKSADAAKAQKRMEKRHTAEQLKRLERDQTRELSRVRTLQAASGFSQKSVTSREYLRDFQQLQREEVDWLKAVGASRFAQREATEQAFKYQQYGQTALAGVSAGALIYDWFKKPTATPGIT